MSGNANKPVVYSDITELVSDLSAISGLPPEKIAGNIFADLGEKIVSSARTRAPMKTGKLRNSISYEVENNGTKLVVGAHVPYAKYMEFGTASRGEFGGQPYTILPRTGQYLTFKVDGKWVRAKKVIHPGIAPRPFMRPAAEEAMGGLADKLAERGALLITKGPKNV